MMVRVTKSHNSNNNSNNVVEEEEGKGRTELVEHEGLVGGEGLASAEVVLAASEHHHLALTEEGRGMVRNAHALDFRGGDPML
jgi:hypothetical protein